jgi:glutaredoxin-like YruB-family protein
MKGIESLDVLKQELQTDKKVWLLLYKRGSDKSDCAFENFSKVANENTEHVLLHADVNLVRDIHPEFKITSVPSLLSFENGELKNIIKGCQRPEQFSAVFDNSVFVSNGNKEGILKRLVTVYTTPTCTWCTTIKRHLQENGVQYREVDVSQDQNAAAEMVRKSGQQGVPQTEINGQMIVGFDKTKINSLLGIN